MSIDLCTIDWVTISTIVTALMAIIAGFALYQNRIQLELLKQQWEYKTRARLSFSIVARQGLFLLKITNEGQQTAYDINLHFSDNFIENLLSPVIKDAFLKIQNNEFCLESDQSKFIMISPIYQQSLHIYGDEFIPKEKIKQWLDANKNTEIVITGKYCKKYVINESLSIEKYIIGSLVIDDELTYAVKVIKDNLVVNNNQYYPIQKSLDIIAKHTEKK